MTNEVLQTIETVIDEALKVAPVAAQVVDTIPGAATFVTPAIAILTVIDQALHAIMNTGVTAGDAMTQVVQHLTPGQPNAPALSQTTGL